MSDLGEKKLEPSTLVVFFRTIWWSSVVPSNQALTEVFLAQKFNFKIHVKFTLKNTVLTMENLNSIAKKVQFAHCAFGPSAVCHISVKMRLKNIICLYLISDVL